MNYRIQTNNPADSWALFVIYCTSKSTVTESHICIVCQFPEGTVGDDYFANPEFLEQTKGRKRAVLMLIAGFIRELENENVLSQMIASSIVNLLYRFTSDERRMTELRALLVGLDGAGKTILLYKLKLGEVVTTIPTIGFNVETVEYKDYSFTMWDVGGQERIRSLWRHYYQVLCNTTTR